MTEPRRQTALLSLSGVNKRFKIRKGLKTQRLHALTDMDLDIAAGEVVALVGESGSGKSTAARIIARLEAPDGGKLLFRGRDVLAEQPRSAPLDYRAEVQMIFQDPFGSLNPVHTIGHHLARPLLRHEKASRADVDERVHELLSTVGLTPAADFAARHPHQLSGGQRQRVAIARALAVDPALILADEPTSMLDLSIRTGILNLLATLKVERSIAYLYITHDLASARYFADRILVLYAGHVVESADSATLIDAPRHPYTQLLLSAVPDPEADIHAPLAARSGMPRLVDPPAGCPFAARCPRAESRCRQALPALEPIAPGHLARCHLLQGATA